LCQWNFSLT